MAGTDNRGNCTLCDIAATRRSDEHASRDGVRPAWEAIAAFTVLIRGTRADTRPVFIFFRKQPAMGQMLARAHNKLFRRNRCEWFNTMQKLIDFCQARKERSELP